MKMNLTVEANFFEDRLSMNKNEIVAYPSKDLERRLGRRMELSLPVLLSGRIIRTKNISSTGAYFEVVTGNGKRFYVGKILNFEIIAKTTAFLLPSKKIRLGGTGEIIRKTLIKSRRRSKVLGVAVRFTDKLEILYQHTDLSQHEKESFGEGPIC